MAREQAYCGMRIGLLGGSFNPAHAGHRHISLMAMKRLRLDRVWWLVSPQNPLKPRAGMASLSDRLASARAAARHPRILVSDLEARAGASFTCDTLALLRKRWPGVRFVWLTGADNLAQMPLWRRWQWIMGNVPVAVLDRPGYGLKSLQGKIARRYAHARLGGASLTRLAAVRPPAWGFMTCRMHPASSTAIRAGLKQR